METVVLGAAVLAAIHHIFCLSLDAAMFQRFIAIVDTSEMSLSDMLVHEVQALILPPCLFPTNRRKNTALKTCTSSLPSSRRGPLWNFVVILAAVKFGRLLWAPCSRGTRTHSCPLVKYKVIDPKNENLNIIRFVFDVLPKIQCSLLLGPNGA